MTKRTGDYAARMMPTKASKPAKPVFKLYNTEALFFPEADAWAADEEADPALVAVAAGRVEVTTGDVAETLADAVPCCTSKYVAFESMTFREHDEVFAL
jgi:hypothetical protein